MTIPLLADKSMAISRAYGVLKEDEGLRWGDEGLPAENLDLPFWIYPFFSANSPLDQRTILAGEEKNKR